MRCTLRVSILLAFVIFLGPLFSQNIHPQHASIDGIREMLETASRAGQEVWVEDFTGLN